MSIFKIHHITKYLYNDNVSESTNQIIVFPRNSENQEIITHDLSISTEPMVHKYTDYWGNTIGVFSINTAHQELIINSSLSVKTIATFCDSQKSKAEDWNILKNEVENNIILNDLAMTENVKAHHIIDNILHELYNKNQTPFDFLMACTKYIFEKFKYEKGITTIESKLDDILVHQSGVCQDFAHILLQLLRTKSIPARYVSGYVCPNKDGMRGEGATHAWVEAYIPHLGWIGVDPTNNCIANEQHIKIAVGRHFKDCSPVKGIYRGSATAQELFVYVSVGYEDGTVFESENEVILFKETELSDNEKRNKMSISQMQQ